MSIPNTISGQNIKSYVERIEKLEEERRTIGGDVRDVYAEAKGRGYDAKTIRWLVSERRIEAVDREERDTLRDVYANAIGMAVDMVRNEGLSLRQAAKAAGVSKSSVHRALAVPAVSQPAREMTADDLGEYEPDPPPMTVPELAAATISLARTSPKSAAAVVAVLDALTDDPGPMPDFLRRKQVSA